MKYQEEDESTLEIFKLFNETSANMQIMIDALLPNDKHRLQKLEQKQVTWIERRDLSFDNSYQENNELLEKNKRLLNQSQEQNNLILALQKSIFGAKTWIIDLTQNVRQMRRKTQNEEEEETKQNNVQLEYLLSKLSEELQKLNHELNVVGHKKNKQKFRYSQVLVAQKLKDQKHKAECDELKFQMDQNQRAFQEKLDLSNEKIMALKKSLSEIEEKKVLPNLAKIAEQNEKIRQLQDKQHEVFETLTEQNNLLSELRFTQIRFQQQQEQAQEIEDLVKKLYENKGQISYEDDVCIFARLRFNLDQLINKPISPQPMKKLREIQEQNELLMQKINYQKAKLKTFKNYNLRELKHQQDNLAELENASELIQSIFQKEPSLAFSVEFINEKLRKLSSSIKLQILNKKDVYNKENKSLQIIGKREFKNASMVKQQPPTDNDPSLLFEEEEVGIIGVNSQKKKTKIQFN